MLRIILQKPVSNIEVLNGDEIYEKGQPDFEHKIGIWSKVAALQQIVDEGYISEADRDLAICEYDEWTKTSAQRMVMKLNETRGQTPYP